MITSILDRVAALPPALREAADRIYHISAAVGRTVPPPEMEDWIIQQFGALDEVRRQEIVKIVNRLTLEGAVFNPLRARRPSDDGGGDAALEERIAAELAAHDFFDAPLTETTADVFGRIRGRYCVTASNVAKFEGWHGLVVFDEPHPLRFNRAQLADYLHVGLNWLAEAHRADPTAIYPMIGWNCLPKSGATLVHGHMHLTLGRGMAYSRVESWRRAAEQYRSLAGARYSETLAALHEALDLGLPAVGEVRAFAHLTPLRNREVIMLLDPAERRGDALLPAEQEAALAETLYGVLRGLIEAQGTRAFNVAIALPPLGPSIEDWSEMPLLARVADRGAPLTSRNDWGVMELFAMGCVTADPFEVAAALRAWRDPAA